MASLTTKTSTQGTTSTSVSFDVTELSLLEEALYLLMLSKGAQMDRREEAQKLNTQLRKITTAYYGFDASRVAPFPILDRLEVV
tara:strand:- start:2946 stop:3197 length:252 start_codon:yes stop_codon:yes gene_type:complete